MTDTAPELGPVMSIDKWPTNGHLIADCARLGYLRDEWVTLDATYGRGKFWTEWRPATLVTNDPDPHPDCPVDHEHSALAWPEEWQRGRPFDAVVFDPPYKLNGTPTEAVDRRYGVHTPTTARERLHLLAHGSYKCAHLARAVLLVKCQDQVNAGKLVWQTDLVTEAVKLAGFRKVDRFDLLSYRPQPAGRSQQHARRCSSQLLVFTRVS